MFTFGIGAFFIIVLLIVLTSVFCIWMLVDCLTNTTLDPTMKLVWVLVIFFGHLLGAVLYYAIARRPTR